MTMTRKQERESCTTRPYRRTVQSAAREQAASATHATKRPQPTQRNEMVFRPCDRDLSTPPATPPGPPAVLGRHRLAVWRSVPALPGAMESPRTEYRSPGAPGRCRPRARNDRFRDGASRNLRGPAVGSRYSPRPDRLGGTRLLSAVERVLPPTGSESSTGTEAAELAAVDGAVEDSPQSPPEVTNS